MTRKSLLCFCLGALLVTGACDDAVGPYLCACPPSGCDVAQESSSLEKVPACQMPAIESGAGFRILHRIDSGVEIDEPVELTLTTPCGATTLRARHDENGIVDLPAQAPRGASCALEVRATIANSTLSQWTHGARDATLACSPEELQCETVSPSGGAAGE